MLFSLFNYNKSEKSVKFMFTFFNMAEGGRPINIKYSENLLYVITSK